MKFQFLFSFLALLLLPAVSFAIRPEQIGGTQYATGHVASAESVVRGLTHKFAPDHVVPEKIVKDIEEMVQNSADKLMTYMQRLPYTVEERKIFIKTIALLQARDKANGASVYLIGTDKAVAVDGHHRIRAQGMYHDIMLHAEKIWKKETVEVLRPMGRVKENGTIVRSLDIDPAKLKVVRTLPKNVTAEELMRELLVLGKGVWENDKLNELGKSFFGREAALKASQEQLRVLAEALGIVNDKKGLKYTVVNHLPDEPVRSLLGYHFYDRAITYLPIEFVDYVEFYVGDEIKNLISKEPDRYPGLKKIYGAPSVDEQIKYLELAAKEFDELIATHPKLRQEILKYSVKSQNVLTSQLARIQYQICTGPNGSKISDCAKFLSSLSVAEKASLESLAKIPANKAIGAHVTFSKASLPSSSNCIEESLRALSSQVSSK